MRARGLLEHAIYGPDLAALQRFYCDVFGLDVLLHAPPRIIALRCGNAVLLLFDPTVSREVGEIPAHGAQGAGHIAFVMDESEAPAWRAHLRAKDVDIEKEVEWPEGGRSIYVRDPAGNSVELAPPGIWRGVGRALLERTSP